MPQFEFPDQMGFYQGKVRDVYTIDNTLLVMIASDRISAFDVILPRPIPYKGQVLNGVAAFMLEHTRDICPNWLIALVCLLLKTNRAGLDLLRSLVSPKQNRTHDEKITLVGAAPGAVPFLYFPCTEYSAFGVGA